MADGNGRHGLKLWRCRNVVSRPWHDVDVAVARGRPPSRVHAGIEGKQLIN